MFFCFGFVMLKKQVGRWGVRARYKLTTDKLQSGTGDGVGNLRQASDVPSLVAIRRSIRSD